MIDPVSGTARWTAAMRAEESAREDRLFDDPLAALLAGDDGRRLLAQDGSAPAVSLRTRFFDDLVAAIVPAQFVMLAAGMDTRAFRLGLPSTTVMYELDRPDLLELKETLLGDCQAVPSCVRRPVGSDLTRDWENDLLGSGFDPDRATLWSVEGLTHYLDTPDVVSLIRRITDLSASGSTLLIDFLGQSILDSPPRREWMARLAERGTPWRFGDDRPEDLLQPEWACETRTLASIGAALGRPSGPDVPRDAPGSAHVFLVHARRR